MNKMIRQLNHDIIKALAVRSGALPRRKAVLERMKEILAQRGVDRALAERIEDL